MQNSCPKRSGCHLSLKHSFLNDFFNHSINLDVFLVGVEGESRRFIECYKRISSYQAFILI
jgi:hypothetical protein